MPVQCTEEPVAYQQYSSLVFANSHLRRNSSDDGQDEDHDSILSMPTIMDDEAWNAQVVKHANQILMALPHLDYSSEEVAKWLDQIQRDVCVLLGEEVSHSYDELCGQDHR